jgi:hypothetical protein
MLGRGGRSGVVGGGGRGVRVSLVRGGGGSGFLMGGLEGVGQVGVWMKAVVELEDEVVGAGSSCGLCFGYSGDDLVLFFFFNSSFSSLLFLFFILFLFIFFFLFFVLVFYFCYKFLLFLSRLQVS